MFLVCAIITVLLGTAHSQCFQLPTEQQIETLIITIIISSGGEGSLEVVNLLEHHYTCIAPGERKDEIRELSIAVIFNVTTAFGISYTRRQQIQLECQHYNTYSPFTGTELLEESPPEVAFNLTTRKDCYLCVVTGPPSVIIDTNANCAGE